MAAICLGLNVLNKEELQFYSAHKETQEGFLSTRPTHFGSRFSTKTGLISISDKKRVLVHGHQG